MKNYIITASIIVALFMAGGCALSDNGDGVPAAPPTSGAGVVTPAHPPPTPQQNTAQAETFGETLQGRLLTGYNWMPQVNRDDIEFFAAVAGYDAARQWMTEAIPPGGAYGQPPPLTLPLSSFEDAVTPNETTKLRSLDPRIKSEFVEAWDFGIAIRAPIPLPADPKAHAEGLIKERTDALLELLMAIPSSIPPAAEILHTEELAQYEALHPDLRKLFWVEVATVYAQGLTVGRGAFPSLNDEQIKDLFSQHIPPLVAYQETLGCSDHSRPCPISRVHSN